MPLARVPWSTALPAGTDMDPVLEGLPDGTPGYFVHSYVLEPESQDVVSGVIRLRDGTLATFVPYTNRVLLEHCEDCIARLANARLELPAPVRPVTLASP